MHQMSPKTEIVRNILKKLDMQFLKKAMTEKAWTLFRGNGRARGQREQMPVQSNEPCASCKNGEPDFVWGRLAFQDQMPALAHELEAACKDVEPKFIQLGEELQAVYQDATKLTQQVLDSANLIGGEKEEGVLYHLRRLAEASLTGLEGCRKDLSEKTDQVKTIQEQLDALSAIFLQVEKTGRLLRIVAVNIAIESARSEESTELFSLVGADTAELSKKIRTVSAGGMDVLKEARDMVRPLYGELSKGLEEITGMGQHAGGIVRDAVREIETLMTSTLQVAEQAGDQTRQISQQVGNLVVAVQFHDGMSQRVEHITKALGDVEAFLIEDAPGKRSLALSIMKVQEAQIREIIDEIGRVNEKGCHSFEEIIRGFNTLLNHLSELSTSAEQDADREKGLDSFERLRTSFNELDGVVRRGEALMDPVRHAASRAADAVGRVSGLVQDIHTIGFESHLMALNAIVKAAHLGAEGGALEVLAQEVKASSNQSTSIMIKANELLELVTGAADKLRDQDSAAEADAALEDATSEMMREYNRFMAESAAAHKWADEIRGVVSESKASLGFLPLLVERLRGSLNRLQTMTRELTPFAPEDHSLSQDEVVDILKRYTMYKERKIHRAVVFGNIDEREQGVPPEALRESPGPYMRTKEAEPEEETAGSIELFTDEDAAKDMDDTDRVSDDPREADEQRDNVEQFVSDTAAEENPGSRDKASEAEETNENEDDFGNNVELF
jgi:uncharacterized protein YoxC